MLQIAIHPKLLGKGPSRGVVQVRAGGWRIRRHVRHLRPMDRQRYGMCVRGVNTRRGLPFGPVANATQGNP